MALLQIKTQGFPSIIEELGIQPPIQGPFWGFESTVIPVINARGPRNEPRSGVVYDGFQSSGLLMQPAADSFMAFTNGVLFPGVWAIRISWAWVNTTPTPSFIKFQRLNDTFALVLEEEVVDVIGGTTAGERTTGSGYRDYVLQQAVFGQPWGLRIGSALGSAGSAVDGSIRTAYLGEIPSLQGF